MPWHHPQNLSLCQNQSDTGSTGEVGRPWGHTGDGTSCRLVRCGARRRRGARCLRGESEGSVPGEVRHSLGEPSWRCHPHPRLLLRSLLRHTPASAAARPHLHCAQTHTIYTYVCVCVSIHSVCMCVQLNAKMFFFMLWNSVTKMLFHLQRQMIERKRWRCREERKTHKCVHALWAYYKMQVQVHVSSGDSGDKWDKHVPPVFMHACESRAHFTVPLIWWERPGVNYCVLTLPLPEHGLVNAS